MSDIQDLIDILQQDGKKRLPILPYLRRQKSDYDLDMISLAYDYAKEAHEGQVRRSGEPYIEHPLQVAITLAQMGLDQTTIIAGLLHDVPEDTNISLVDIEKNFGAEVANLVAGITKLGVIKYRGMERHAENLRRMFISMAQDIRIILIKMADRIHNLKTLDALPLEKRQRIAQESLEIYAPIANRLGMGGIKGQLEDLAFPHLYPKEYHWLVEEVMPKVESTMPQIERTIQTITKELSQQKVPVTSVHGRKKQLYSLYEKLIRPQYNRDITKIHDAVAVRLIVPTISDCYHALGIIHRLWKPLPGRIKDYISQPKPNGYQSLHTTVFCGEGQIVEIQIRTQEMHNQAEYGIASHWKYKEARKMSFRKQPPQGYNAPKKLKWVDDLVAWQKEVQDNQQYLKTLSVDFFHNRIFVFTPKGDVIDLPEDATPVDFAYHVHSYIGDHCSGSRVNGHISSLDVKLKNGDVVEIITDKNRKGPSPDWIKFVKSAAAKGKIKSFRKHKY